MQALEDSNENNDAAACGSLAGFINEVSDLIAEGVQTSALGQPLIESATSARAALDCRRRMMSRLVGAGLTKLGQVTGVRQDGWVEPNRIPVEVDKPPEMQRTWSAVPDGCSGLPTLAAVEQGIVACRERLGGLLRYYYRKAA